VDGASDARQASDRQVARAPQAELVPDLPLALGILRGRRHVRPAAMVGLAS